jgi:hypothetical protein
MGEQILLLKIELDPEIASVFQHFLAPRFNLNLDPDPRRNGIDAHYRQQLGCESNRETDKANSFADDNSTGTLATFASLNKLKTVVNDFGVFSGLKSNPEKTTLLKMGPVGPMSQEILDLGFSIVNNVILLGLNVDNNLSSLSTWFDDVIIKVARVIEYWDRFNLSLPGRISVCKTFMLSQIGYLGSFITPTTVQMSTLQESLNRFCLGKLNIAKKKLYLPTCEGGLGLIDLKAYIIAIQSSWIKRITQHWCDMWRFDIKNKCYGNPFLADEFTFRQETNPALHNICKSFGKFKSEFYRKDQNYTKAFILKNQMFKRGRNDNGILCENFFGRQNSYEFFKKISELKFEDFFERGRARSLDNFNNSQNLEISLVTYMRLHGAFQFYVDTRRRILPAPSVSLNFYMKTFQKGSRPLRNVMMHFDLKKADIAKVNTVVSFFEIIELQMLPPEHLKMVWGMWGNSSFGNRCREFIFKFYNNILGLNSRVAKFVQNHPSECTLCTVGKEPLPIMAETFSHVFFSCQYTEKYRVEMQNYYFPELDNLNDAQKKLFWLCGILTNNGETIANPAICATVCLINFYIWKCKLQKTLPAVSDFKGNITSEIKYLLKQSKYFREAREKNYDIFFCRLRLA